MSTSLRDPRHLKITAFCYSPSLYVLKLSRMTKSIKALLKGTEIRLEKLNPCSGKFQNSQNPKITKFQLGFTHFNLIKFCLNEWHWISNVEVNDCIYLGRIPKGTGWKEKPSRFTLNGRHRRMCQYCTHQKTEEKQQSQNILYPPENIYCHLKEGAMYSGWDFFLVVLCQRMLTTLKFANCLLGSLSAT